MHMYVDSSKAASSSSGLQNSNNFEKISDNVHQQIEIHRKYKLTSDLNIKEKEHQLAELRKSFESLNMDYMKLKIENDRTKMDLKESESSKAKAYERIENLTDALKRVKIHIVDIEERIATYEKITASYHIENAKKHKKLADLDAQMDALVEQKRKTVDEIRNQAKLESEQNEIKLSNRDAEIKSLKIQISEMNDEFKLKNRQLCNLHFDNNALLKENKEFKTGMDNKIKFEEIQSKELDESKKKIHDLSEKMTILVKLIDANLVEKLEYSQKLEKAAKTEHELIEQKVALETQVSSLSSHIENLTAKMSSQVELSEQRVTELSQKCQHLEAAYESLNVEKNSLLANTVNLKLWDDKLKATKELQAEQNFTISTMQFEIRTIMGANEDLKISVNQLTQKLAESAKKEIEAKEMFQNLNSQIKQKNENKKDTFTQTILPSFTEAEKENYVPHKKNQVKRSKPSEESSESSAPLEFKPKRKGPIP